MAFFQKGLNYLLREGGGKLRVPMPAAAPQPTEAPPRPLEDPRGTSVQPGARARTPSPPGPLPRAGEGGGTLPPSPAAGEGGEGPIGLASPGFGARMPFRERLGS